MVAGQAASTAGLAPFIDTAFFDFSYGDTSAGDRIIDSQWVTSTVYESTVMGRDGDWRNSSSTGASSPLAPSGT